MIKLLFENENVLEVNNELDEEILSDKTRDCNISGEQLFVGINGKLEAVARVTLNDEEIVYMGRSTKVQYSV